MYQLSILLLSELLPFIGYMCWLIFFFLLLFLWLKLIFFSFPAIIHSLIVSDGSFLFCRLSQKM